MPEKLIEVPVPPGIIINPLESKLDRFTCACLARFMFPGGTLENVDYAWQQFSSREQELLGLAGEFVAWQRLGFFARWWPGWVDSMRKDIMRRMSDRATEVRAGLMSERIRRPPHENPKTMLVAV